MIFDFSHTGEPSSAHQENKPGLNSLFEDAYQLVKQHSLEAGGAVVGIGLLLVKRGEIASILRRAARAEDLEAATEFASGRTAFLESRYLHEPYIVPDSIKRTLDATASELTQKFPEFVSLISVGGTSNGSLALRLLERENVATDLDFYLAGHATSPERLQEMSRLVTDRARSIGLGADGVLNGRDPGIYLNLDTIDQHVAQGDFNLLALPFQSSFGRTRESMASVLDRVLQRADKQAVWDEIGNAHAQSLSMHHGSWSIEFGNRVLNEYYPQKIERFGLPATPEKMLEQLTRS